MNCPRFKSTRNGHAVLWLADGSRDMPQFQGLSLRDAPADLVYAYPRSIAGAL